MMPEGGVAAMSIHVPFLGRLKFKPIYSVRSSERVLLRFERMALTFLPRRGVRERPSR